MAHYNSEVTKLFWDHKLILMSELQFPHLKSGQVICRLHYGSVLSIPKFWASFFQAETWTNEKINNERTTHGAPERMFSLLIANHPSQGEFPSISTWGLELCLTVLYHITNSLFSPPSFIHSFRELVTRQILRSYHMPSTVVGARDTKRNKAKTVSALVGLLVREPGRPTMHGAYAEVGQDAMGAFSRGLHNLFGFQRYQS